MEDLMLEGALKILSKFSQEGYEAYIVGGYVRDHLLNMKGKDIDITTNCLPDEVRRIFPDNYAQSAKFKTVTVREDGFEYEVTTYRTDKHYSDHRHPETKVAKTLRSDVRRRDFTCNAICMDKNMNIIDYVNGEEDIRNAIIKTVGSPSRRFNEDALRMLRCFRFASRLNFKIEEETYDAIKHSTHLMKFVSKERIRDELSKMLLEPYFKDKLPIILESGIFKLYPDILKALTILNVNFIKVDIINFLCLASYLKGSVTDELLLSRKEIRYIEKTLFYTDKMINRKINAADLLDIEEESLDSAFTVLDIIGQRYYTKEEIMEFYNSLPIKTAKDVKITGNDIKKAMILGDSPLIKIYIEKALYGVLFHDIPNEKGSIIKYLREENNEQ